MGKISKIAVKKASNKIQILNRASTSTLNLSIYLNPHYILPWESFNKIIEFKSVNFLYPFHKFPPIPSWYLSDTHYHRLSISISIYHQNEKEINNFWGFENFSCFVYVAALENEKSISKFISQRSSVPLCRSINIFVFYLTWNLQFHTSSNAQMECNENKNCYFIRGLMFQHVLWYWE